MRRLTASQIVLLLRQALGPDAEGAGKTKKLQLTLSADAAARLERLTGRFETNKPGVAVGYALTLPKAALAQFDDGRVLLARDREGGRRDVLLRDETAQLPTPAAR